MIRTLYIDPQTETEKISRFILSVLTKTGFKNVIIAVSGGIDSATSLNVLSRTIPIEHIFVVHLYYFKKSIELYQTTIKKLNIPESNILLYSIKESVDEVAEKLELRNKRAINRTTTQYKETNTKVIEPFIAQNYDMRLGNIMARTRMIYLYDLARKHNALVCGTENKSEYYLGYFTRYGDEAADFEPIRHLYKSQVRQLAEYLNVPETIRTTSPSAGLWVGQTDEGELGFTYEEADKVLYLYYDQNVQLNTIVKQGYAHAEKIIEFSKKNAFKHEVPYLLHKKILAE